MSKTCYKNQQSTHINYTFTESNKFACIAIFLYHRTSTFGRMIPADSGALLIIGSFKKRVPDPDFKVKELLTFFLIKYKLFTYELIEKNAKPNLYVYTHE